MNFEHYKNFVMIVDCHNISAAAERLHIAQSALSSQVKAFEELLGAKLLIRYPRYVELTDAGKIFYQAAKNMMRIDQAAQKEIRDCSTGRRGTLRLGLTPAFPDNWVQALLRQFSEENPLVSYEIYEANTGDLMELLKTGVIECAIIRTPEFLPPVLEAVHTVEEQFYAFAASDASFLSLSAEQLLVSELKGVPLSVPRGFQGLITACCQSHDFEPDLFSVSSSRNTTLLWARLGRAVALLSCDPTSSGPEGELIRIPVIDPMLTARRSIAVLRGVRLSAVCQAFLTCSSRIKTG